METKKDEKRENTEKKDRQIKLEIKVRQNKRTKRKRL